MNEILNIVLTSFKNKKIIVFVAILTIILIFKANFIVEYSIIVDSVERIITVLSENILIVIFTVVLLVSVVSLFKYSDKKHQMELDDWYGNYYRFDSELSYPFKLEVIEDAKYIAFNERPYRKFVIQNNTGSELEYCRCIVNLYFNKEKIMEVEVESKWIQNGYKFSSDKIRGAYSLIWNEFDLFVIEARSKDNLIRNSRYCYKKVDPIPPQISHKNIIERLSPWDLKWFKRNVLCLIFNYIRHVYTSVVYMPPNASKEWKRSRFLNIFRKIYCSIFLLIIIPLITMYIYFFGKMAYDISVIIITLFGKLFSSFLVYR